MNKNVTKNELVIRLVAECPVPLGRHEAEIVVDTVIDELVHAIQNGERIELRGFGSFRIRSRAARKGRNPKTGATVMVPPKRAVYFRPGKDLKALLNLPSARKQI